jgi:hypothetical protein
MARSRSREHEELENALALLSVVAREAAILEAHAAHARCLENSRPIILDSAARIRRAADKSRAHLSKVWNGFEEDYHEQA